MKEKLYDEIFPIKVYHNDYYLPHKLTASQKMYLAIYENCHDIKKTEILMRDQFSRNHVINIRKKLIELNLIETTEKFTDPEKAKEFCIKNSHKGFKCEWCGKESYMLHQHHYPVPSNKGGKNLVNICPNCHATFHNIMGE